MHEISCRRKKPPSQWKGIHTHTHTPPPNEHQDIENICKQTEQIPINLGKSKDNLMNLRKGPELLLEEINTNKIIKPADKESSIVVMRLKDYWNKCSRHLSDTTVYNNLDNNDQSHVRHHPLPTERILVALSPPSLSHSPDLGCVGAQRIMFLGRILV